MNEHTAPDDLAELRAAFMVDDAGESALGWPGVHAFEAEHGVVLPEPYRNFVAEITDGSFAGPPDFGLLGINEMPDDWGDDRPVRELAASFPLTEAWLWGGGLPAVGGDRAAARSRLRPWIDRARHGWLWDVLASHRDRPAPRAHLEHQR
ncbi:SMI1/KNR4 family protein [Micromonospora craterilacus]|uniref:SMI1/KNR4 family protein n=1 Tax=Micromonospora craterilacus TaxID=1655439 RepID=UPI0018F7AA0A|nr:SMI1/KNR4 family protein [Micromonospora craterilacus]